MRLEIRDSRDRTPILIATEGKLMFYDPVALEVLYGEFLAAIKLEVKSNPERKVELNFVFTHVETKQKMADKLASIVLIDIPAILELVVQPWTIKTNNQKDFVLSGTTTNEGIVEMYLEPGRQFGPLKKINFSRKDVNQGIPFLRIDQYNMNIPLDDQIFTFPTTVMKNVDLPIKELGKLLSVQAMYSKMQYARALMSRGN
jgi:hypothetical protein